MTSSFEQGSVNVDELQRQAEWLRSGRLDTTASLGNVATDVVIEDKDGTWKVPLVGGIDVVNEADGRFMQESRADASVEEPNVLNSYTQPVIEVVWTGTDDEIRRSVADVAAATFTPAEK